MCGNKIQILEKGVTAAKVSTYVTMGLAVVKATVGYLSGSVALSADAVHSLSDTFTIVAVWLGLRLSKRKPSERFPYGFYRVETFTFLLVSVIIAVSGAQILIESFQRALAPHAVTFITVTLPVAAFSALVSWSLFQYKSNVGGEIKSQALMGEAKHSMVDIWSSALVFVGILAQYAGFSWAEPVVGFLIGLLVIRLGLGMGKNAILVLLDACLEPKLVSQMRNIAAQVDGVKGVHDIKARRSGSFLFGEMHVELGSKTPLDKVAIISVTIEDRIKSSITELDSLLIQTEPSKKDVYRIAIPVELDNGLNSKASEHFGKSPYFLFIDVREGNPTNWFSVENPAARLNRKKGLKAAHLIARHNADVLIAKEVGEGPYHVLRDNSTQILELNTQLEIKQILNAFTRKEMRTLTPAEKKQT